MILSIEEDSIATYPNEKELVTILPKDGESLNAKNGEKDDEKPPINQMWVPVQGCHHLRVAIVNKTCD